MKLDCIKGVESEENRVLKKQRELELLNRKLNYYWQIFEELGFSSAIDDTSGDIPADEQFIGVKDIDFNKSDIETAARLKFAGGIIDINDLGDM